MSRSPSHPRSWRRPALALCLLGLLPLACGDGPYAKQPAADAPAKDPASASAETPSTPEAKPHKTVAVPTAHEDGKPLAKVLPTAPLPLTKLLGAPPPEVETFLGEVEAGSKGGLRESCVRYLPERTWFRCKNAWQRYTDKTGNFGVVQVTYEDGKAASLAFEKLPGSGPFDPKAALRSVGLELPGTPAESSPAEDVTVWQWWNNEARLIVHQRQYRVRVSTVQGQWDRAKVEIILNDPLTDDQKSRVVQPGGNADGGDAPPQ